MKNIPDNLNIIGDFLFQYYKIINCNEEDFRRSPGTEKFEF